MHPKLENVTITDEQAELIKTWFEANSSVSGRINGYALGTSYIDTRANSGRGISERRRYVKIDHETAEKVPQLRGFYKEQIVQFMNQRANISEETSETTFKP